jgi:hypothetical protein
MNQLTWRLAPLVAELAAQVAARAGAELFLDRYARDLSPAWLARTIQQGGAAPRGGCGLLSPGAPLCAAPLRSTVAQRRFESGLSSVAPRSKLIRGERGSAICL